MTQLSATIRRYRAAAALLLSCSLVGGLMSACSSPASGHADSNSAAVASTAGGVSESFEQALATFTSSVTSGSAPKEGISTAALVGDVTPIVDNPSPVLPVSLTDADGYQVEVTDVSRILPLDLYGTTSRTVAGLGLGDKIVGRTVSSAEPSLRDVPVVTQSGHNINVEAVLNLRPSLVLVDHSIGPREAIDQIRQAGVTVVVINPSRSMESIGDDIRTIAAITGVEEAGEKLAARAEKERDEAIAAIAQVAPQPAPLLAFLYARGNGGVFFILGPETGTTDLFTAVGATDAAAIAGLADTTPATAEALVNLNPDVIVMMTAGLESTGGLSGVLERPGVAQTKAGIHQRIVTIPDSQALSFGPQTGQMLLAFAQALYGPVTTTS